MEHACRSSIAAVSVFGRGALVTRAVECPDRLPEGKVDLVVDGITLLAEGGSLRATVGGRREVAGVQSRVVVPEREIQPGETVARVRELRGRLQRLRDEHGHLRSRTERLRQIELAPLLAAASRGLRVDERMGDAIAAAAMLRGLAVDVDARVVELAEQIERLERELRAAELVDGQASSRERMGPDHPTRRVTIRLDGAGPVSDVKLTYAVPAARWWPVYTLRIADGGKRGSWWLEALVAQLSGEDWSGARLSLSTADLVFDARLPELPSLRLGRAQVPRKAYRLAPAGLDAMFAAHDRAFPMVLPPVAASEAWQGEITDAPSASMSPEPEMLRAPMPGGGMPRGGAMPPPAPPAPQAYAPSPRALADDDGAVACEAAPMAKKERARLAPSRSAYAGLVASASVVGTARMPPPPEPAPIEPDDAWLDFDGLTLVALGARRGRLARVDDSAASRARGRAVADIDGITPSMEARDPVGTRGLFDHRYEAAGLCEVPSDGRTHRVTLATAAAAPTLRWRAVPQRSTDVFREAEMTNPFDAPLLAGPVDVYLDGSLLAVTSIGRIDRGGQMIVGMGVEERIRLARNLRAEETTAGMFGGATVITHRLSIDLVSSLTGPAKVEVVERVPVADEEDIKVEVLDSQPTASRYDQAERGAPIRQGLRWSVALPPAGKARLELTYRVTLPSKNELIGGNRRE